MQTSTPNVTYGEITVSVLPKEQELIVPEYCVNIFRVSVRPPTDKRRVSILCVKQHIYVVF